MTGESRNVAFNTDPVAKVNDRVIRDLKQKALASPARTFRLCLHHDVSDPVQEMIIVHSRGAYIRPHRHDTETESFHVLEGAMLVVLFDEQGGEVDRFQMAGPGSGDCCVCRLDKGRWHVMVPLTDQVVFLETTPGPFRGPAHNTFASWAPAPDDRGGIERFMKSLER